MTIIHFNLDPYTSEAYTVGTGSTIALTTANYAPSTGIGRGQVAQMAFVSLETSNMRFVLASGATPSTTCGHVLVAGDYLVLDGVTQIQGVQFFNEGATASANVRVTYFIS